MLFIPAILYEGLVRLRNKAYSAGMIKQLRLPGPVVSIGNLTLGGTGKTPLVIFIADKLLKLGHPTALLSRGYGRIERHQSFVLAPECSLASSPSSIGDEPALIQRRVPGIWLGISKNRHSAGQQIAALQSDAVFILDDGFQHRELHRDLDIVVVDPMQPFASNRIFPLGSLREPLTGIRRSRVVFINGSSSTLSGAEVERTIRSIHPGARIFHCLQKIDSIIPFADWQESNTSSAARPPDKSAFLVAAIGNPERFQKDAENAGIEVRGSHFYRDHHSIESCDWRHCAQEAEYKKASFILTTEKDAIKFSHAPAVPLRVAIQSICIEEADEFEAILKLAIKGVQ